MISRHTYKKITWIDLVAPTRAEIATLKEEYTLPPLVADELYEPTTRSKVDRYDDELLYLILHFPTLGRTKRGFKEIDFVIGKDFIITSHYEQVSTITEFAGIFDNKEALENNRMGEHAGFVFFSIMRELYNETIVKLDEVNSSLLSIEERMFEGKEGRMVEVISGVNRKIIDFKQALRFHDEVLKSFETSGTEFFGADFTYYLRGITGEYNKAQSILTGHEEIIRDLRETNDSLLTNKTNQAMRSLTVMNFVFLPLTLIAGIFGMNAEFLFIHDHVDFFIILGGMVVIGFLMFRYFRNKRWI